MFDESPERGELPVDDLLARTAPRVSTITPSVEDELARMSVGARTDTAPTGSTRRRASRVAAIALSATLVIGGAGAAAAVTGGFTSWWAGEPDATYQFVLPSGALCEARWGNVMAGTAHKAMRAAARDYLGTADLVDDEAIAAEITRMRADRDVWLQNADGTRSPAWYGTEGYKSPDAEYEQAVSASLALGLRQELQRQGFDVDAEQGGRGLSVEGEISCPGARW